MRQFERFLCSSSLTDIFKIHVLKQEHRYQFLLGSPGESATLDERCRILVRTEHSIPEQNVPEVVFVYIKLVVNRMQLRRLNQVPPPLRGSHIGVIKIFSSAGEKVVPEGSHQGATKQWVQDKCTETGIAQDLDGMLVERRQQFDPRWRMVNLMKYQPPSLYMP